MEDDRDPTTRTLAERVVLASDWLAAFDPATAAWMMAKAAEEPPEVIDATALRKSVLRLVARVHFTFKRRTTAARLIASAWANLPDDAGMEEPGSLNEMLHRLHRSHIPPVEWRVITDLLDPKMDRPQQKPAKS